VTGAWHLRLPSPRLGPLFVRWLLQGAWLALLFGIALAVLGLAALTLVFLTVIFWPLVIPAGCLLLGVWAYRRSRPVPPSPPPEPAVLRDASWSMLPVTARERVDRIRWKAGALAESTGSSEDRYLVQRTLDDYLPGAVDAYLSLPPGSADWPVTPEGRTGLTLLEDQLDLLERNLDQIAGHAWQQGAQRLLAHQRFLEERLGPGLREELDLPR
jgi:hypothetical protein